MAKSNFENSYQPTPREICEMDASPSYAKLSEACKSLDLFKPFVKSDFYKQSKKISVTKEEFPGWSFPDAYFENRKNTQNKEELVFTVGDGAGYLLDLEMDHDLVSVAIGQLDGFIVVELKESLGGAHTWYKQMIFTPQSCEGYEGYDDEIFYHMTSSLGWSGAFTSEVYQKTYFSPPLCN